MARTVYRVNHTRLRDFLLRDFLLRDFLSRQRDFLSRVIFPYSIIYADFGALVTRMDL